MLRFFPRLAPSGARQEGKKTVSRIGSLVPLRRRRHGSIPVGPKAQSAATFEGATAKGDGLWSLICERPDQVSPAGVDARFPGGLILRFPSCVISF
jgi:hypothetical protein